ncbi:hypothetical protein GCM10012279_15250 [Micromonospora yangpuensis]|nr:hypothetical protein GCM10012279_15250 [Micromonospora yangpuensis]
MRPGGRFVACWNIGQPPAELAAAFGEVYRRVLPDSPMADQTPVVGPDAYDPLRATAADGLRGTGAFDEPRGVTSGCAPGDGARRVCRKILEANGPSRGTLLPRSLRHAAPSPLRRAPM